jgi:hypothetical protein
MTAEEWETTGNVWAAMLPLLKERNVPRTKGGRRRLRLFTAAVCRLGWPLLAQSHRGAIELMERVADGYGSDQDLKLAAVALKEEAPAIPDQARPLLDAPDKRNAAVYAALVVTFGLERPAYDAACVCSQWAGDIPGRLARGDSGFGQRHKECRAEAWRVHADILRDLFGNPFRPLPAVKFPPSVRGVAEAVYQSQDAAEYQILADALEEQGRLDQVLGPAWLDKESGLYLPVKHLRQPSPPHVKGCHIVDWARGMTGSTMA